MLDKPLGHPFHQEFQASISPGGIHLAGNQIVRVAMFLHHARPPLLVVQEKLKTFNIGQANQASIMLGIWCINLAGNQIARVAIFLHHARFPLLIVQENLKTFNVGEEFGASILLGIWGIHWAGNQIVRVVMFLHSCRVTSPGGSGNT